LHACVQPRGDSAPSADVAYTVMAKALGELLSDRQVYVLETLTEDIEPSTDSHAGVVG